MDLIKAWLILDSLRSNGFDVTVGNGQLLVTPGSKLKPVEVEAIANYRDLIMGWIEDPEGSRAAMSAEAYEPDWNTDGPVVLREVDVFHLEGFPPMSFPRSNHG